MIGLKKALLFCLIFLFSTSLIVAKEHSRHCFKLSDLKGTYIAKAFTVGSSNTDGSATIFTFKLNGHGTGTIPFFSERVNQGTVFPGFPTSPVFRFSNLQISVTLNSDGTGQFLTHNFPTPGDTTITDMVVKKEPGSNQVSGGYLLKVQGTGPNANGASQQEVKLFTFERQF